MIKLKG